MSIQSLRGDRHVAEPTNAPIGGKTFHVGKNFSENVVAHDNLNLDNCSVKGEVRAPDVTLKNSKASSVVSDDCVDLSGSKVGNISAFKDARLACKSVANEIKSNQGSVCAGF